MTMCGSVPSGAVFFEAYTYIYFEPPPKKVFGPPSKYSFLDPLQICFLKEKKIKKNCLVASIRIGQEIRYLLYAGLLLPG